MQRKQRLIYISVFLLTVFLYPQILSASTITRINAQSAILIDMESGCVLFEQRPDSPIPPASITKILTLYLVFDAIKEGQLHLWDKVEVSRRAASTGGSRMGLKAGTRVSLDELIKGMAVVSGNDACVAAAEHLSGSVERFVVKMNAKARELGMTSSRFLTPNGLPAPGQVTTARDIAKLSMAYLHRFPESLNIHSMQAYTYGKNSHHNANRLLGKCPGVDGLKTGFVCASGYNISATARRGGTRILAVVLGARTPWIRLAETEKLIEAGFRECGAPHADVKYASNPEHSGEIKSGPARKASRAYMVRLNRKQVKSRLASVSKSRKPVKAGLSVKAGKGKKTALSSASARNARKSAAVCSPKAKRGKNIAVARNPSAKSAHVKSGKAVQSAKAKKSLKSVKSTGKQPAKKAITGKKGPCKSPSQAHVLKKKIKG